MLFLDALDVVMKLLITFAHCTAHSGNCHMLNCLNLRHAITVKLLIEAPGFYLNKCLRPPALLETRLILETRLLLKHDQLLPH